MSILKLTADTLVSTPVAGNLEYDGDMYFTDSAANRGQIQRITRETAKAYNWNGLTNNTVLDFTGIPAWVTKITVMFNGVSTSGTSFKQIQLGDSGGIETTGYLGGSSGGGATYSSFNSTTGFNIQSNVAANLINGSIVLTSLSGNTWTCMGIVSGSESAYSLFTSGAKTLSDVLTQIRITTVNGTDTFDAGTVNILYEG